MKKDKIIIGYRDSEEYAHQQNSNLKLEILQSAILEFKKQCNSDVLDMVEFERSFYKYSLTFIKKKHIQAISLGVSDAEFIRMFGYSFDNLKQLEENYNTQMGSITIIKNIAAINQSLDFNVYCENDKEIERYNDVMELITSVKNIHQKYFLGQCLINQMQFINRLYVTNGDGTVLTPNQYFIKNV